MDKSVFLNELIDILEIESGTLNEESEIHLTSLSTLSVMAFVYESFEKQLKTTDLQKINCVKNLIDLIGHENFT